MLRESEGVPFERISKYRKLLMGVAILAIVFCHLDIAQKDNGLDVSHLASMLHLFTVGVDVFMFLSGFGLYYSCERKHYTYLAFLKKRVSRILPYYFGIAGITYLILMLHNNTGAALYFERLFFVSWAKRGSTLYWFILAILVFYAVFPVVFHLLHRIGRHAGGKLLLFFTFFWLITAFIDRSFDAYHTFRIAIERFPVFVLGALCGKLSMEGKKCPRPVFIALITVGFVASAMLYLCRPYKRWINHTHFMYYLSRGLLSLAIMGTCIVIMDWLEEHHRGWYEFLLRFLQFFGGITLEIYLFHQSYLLLFDYPCSLGGYLLAAVILPVFSAIVLFWILKRVSDKGEVKA